MKNFIKNERGQSTVEFALIVPVLLLIVCGILDFGWIYANQYNVENAAYSGARYASIYVGEYTNETMNELIANTKERVKDNLLSTEEEADITVIVEADQIKVEVVYPIKNLTFVAQTFYGKYYNATSTSVSSI